MAVRPRGDSWQVDVFYKGVRKTETRPTQALAEEREDTLRAELILGAHAPRKVSWTLGEALAKTWEKHWDRSKSQRTMHKIALALERYWTKARDVGSITQEDVDAWVRSMKAKGNAGGTINRNLSGLSKVLRVAKDYGKLSELPKIRKEKEHTGRIRFLTRDEEARLVATLAQLGHTEEAAAVVVLVDTGMRCGELLRISARDITPDGAGVTVWENKADHPRTIPMTPRVRGILEARLKTGGPFFPHPENWLHRPWHQVKAAMKLEDDDQFVPHCLRHTFASRLVQAGVPILTVQKLLGHKTLVQTMRYSHLASGNLVAAIQTLVTQPVTVNAPEACSKG